MCIGLALGAALTTGAWTYRRLSDPARLREVVRAALQPLFNGTVSVGEVRFALPGRMVVTDLVVRATPVSLPSAAASVDRPSIQPARDEAIRCPRIEMEFRLWDLLTGRSQPTSLALRNPEIDLRQDRANGKNALATLFRDSDARGGEQANGAPTEAPKLEIDDARVRLDAEDSLQPIDLRFTVRGLPAIADPRTLDVSWSTASDGNSGRFQFDLRNHRLRNVGGPLPALPIDTLIRLAEGAGASLHEQTDRFQLGGTVRITDFDLRFDGHAGNDSLVVELSEGSATLPVDNVAVSSDAASANEDVIWYRAKFQGDAAKSDVDAHYLTFSEASARVSLVGDRVSFSSAARLHGADVSLTGDFTFDGDWKDFARSTAGALRVEVKRFRLPRIDGDTTLAERRFVGAFQILTSIYHDYDPHGFVDLELRLHKAPGASLQIDHGLVTILDADASFRFRPYRGTQIRGSVEFNSGEFLIHEITGQHEGGTVTVNGRVLGTDRCAVCDIQVHASDLPIDEMLYGAVPTTFVGAARDFQLAGRVGLAMNAARSGCVDGHRGPWTSQTTVTLDDVAAQYVRFPYPVTDLRGQITFEGERLRLNSITGRHGRGKVEATGAVDVSGSQISAIDLAIDGTDLEFDDAIVSALPAEARERWAALHLGGNLNTHTRIFLDPETRSMKHESAIDLRGATLQHTLLPLPFTEISGRARLTQDRIETDELHARCRDAEVRAEGWTSLTGDSGSWHFQSPAFVLDDALVDVLPDAWKQRLRAWRIEGPIAIEMQADRNVSDQSAEWNVDLSATLDGAVVRRVGLAQPFEDVRGTIRVDGAGIRAPFLDARLDAGRIHAAFDAKPDERGEQGFVALSADGLRLGPWVRELLPARLRSAWTAADPTGRIDVRIDRLDFNSTDPAGRDTWSVDGRMDLHEVTLRGTPSLENLSGRISGFGFLVDRLGGCTLNGDLALDSAGFLGRDIADLHAAWSLLQSKDGVTNFGLDRINGKVYGGSLTGQVEAVADNSGTRYTLSATAQDVEINPWLNAGRRASHLEPIPSDIRGEADAHLYFAGLVGDAASQRGGGMVEIHDARLYKLPILLAILSVLNVSMPEQQAFDEAHASFYVVGNRMHFNDIALRGPSLALLGTGAMTFPDQGLDLDLFSVNPRQWARVPGISDLFEGTSRQLVGIQVTGSMRSPMVRVKPLQGIAEEFRRLFQKRKPTPLRPATG